jgi:hypothetical protein
MLLLVGGVIWRQRYGPDGPIYPVDRLVIFFSFSLAVKGYHYVGLSLYSPLFLDRGILVSRLLLATPHLLRCCLWVPARDLAARVFGQGGGQALEEVMAGPPHDGFLAHGVRLGGVPRAVRPVPGTVRPRAHYHCRFLLRARVAPARVGMLALCWRADWWTGRTWTAKLSNWLSGSWARRCVGPR